MTTDKKDRMIYITNVMCWGDEMPKDSVNNILGCYKRRKHAFLNGEQELSEEVFSYWDVHGYNYRKCRHVPHRYHLECDYCNRLDCKCSGEEDIMHDKIDPSTYTPLFKRKFKKHRADHTCERPNYLSIAWTNDWKCIIMNERGEEYISKDDEDYTQRCQISVEKHTLQK